MKRYEKIWISCLPVSAFRGIGLGFLHVACWHLHNVLIPTQHTQQLLFAFHQHGSLTPHSRVGSKLKSLLSPFVFCVPTLPSFLIAGGAWLHQDFQYIVSQKTRHYSQVLYWTHPGIFGGFSLSHITSGLFAIDACSGFRRLTSRLWHPFLRVLHDTSGA